MEKKVQIQTLLTRTDTEILSSSYSGPEFIVPDLIPVGLTILAGKPKTGKSLAAMDLAISIANGSTFLGRFEMAQQEVLYLALEDTERRIQTRLNRLSEDPVGTGRLHCATDCPRLDQEFFENLNGFLSQKTAIRLIIIDTFNKVRSLKRQGTTPYEKDYNEVSRLKKFADMHNIAIILIHHLRKSEAKDVTEMIAGSVGLTAVADAIIVLQRERGSNNANFFATGRDIPDFEIGLILNQTSLTWEIAIPTEEMTAERTEVLEVLQGANGAMKLGDIAELVRKKKNNVHKLLAGLIASGKVTKIGYGSYQAQKGPEPTGDDELNPGEPGESSEKAA